MYVIATAHIRPEARETFLAAARTCIADTLDEPGCIRYDLYASVTEPDVYVFVEEWASQAAIDAHFAAPHTRAFLAVAGECVAFPPVIEIIAPESVLRR